MKRHFASPLLLLLLLTSACATQQAAPSARPVPGAPPIPTDPNADLPTDPSITIGTLENGLRYYIRPHRVPGDRAELWLVVDAGSVQEDEDQRGLAHFVEHMAFNGTENFAKQELVQYLESIGMRFGADINASTGFDETMYTLTVPTDKPEFVEKGFQILEDWAHGITFDAREVEAERGVVIEEWRLGRDAEGRMLDQQFPILFQGSRYAERLPIGKKEILETVTPEALQRFYRDWYRPDLMAVIAVGDFDPETIEAQIREHFSDLENPDTPRPREVFPVPGHEETLVAIATDPEATDTTVGIYAKRPVRPQHRVGDYRRMIVEGLYHNLLNARLNEITRRPDAPFLWGGSTTGGFVRSAEVTYQAVGVREGEAGKGLAALLTEVERVHRHGFTPTELERAKKDWLLGYEKLSAERQTVQSGTLAAEYSRNFLEDEPVPGIPAELALVRRFLPEITLDDVNRLAEDWLADSNRVILVDAPAKPDAPPPAREALLATFQAVQQSEIAPYEDRIQAGPLVAQRPRPGRITGEKRIAEVGVTEWRLGNGVRVVLKPTTTQRDEILLTAFSPGGHSLVSDAELPSALFAASLLRASGLGSFDEITLGKALAGTTVDVEPYITQLEEGIEGQASTGDAELLFQMVYLTFTAPRRDEDTFRVFKDQLRNAIANRQAQPEAAFADELTKALTQGHPRWKPITPEFVDQVDLDTAYRIYRERFADASDFTFILVGNVSAEKIRPLVLTWLGGLPSLNRNESGRDVGMEPPAGVVRVDVSRGIEPRSQVQIVFTGSAEFSRENRHDLSALASVLETRLREVLREDMGAVYGVSVSGDISRRPRPQYELNIGFACAPEKVDSLVQAVFAEIAAIQQNGIGDRYVQQVKETERRTRELNLADNEFWRAVLELYLTEGLDIRDIPRFDDLIAQVSSERIRDTARRYLDTSRYVLGVLRPAA